MKFKPPFWTVIFLALTLTGCTFNPFTTHNDLTGNAESTAIGAGVGAGAAWLSGGSKSLIAASGIGGALVGYYASTLRFEAGGIVQGGGQVFSLGDYLTIEVPSDRLFDVNTADFLDDVQPVLNSIVMVLNRSSSSNIIVSGNTSGFGSAKFEHKLSQDRARKVAGYLWSHGIGDLSKDPTCPNIGSLKMTSMRIRSLTYVGYGNYFPIANDIRNKSIRQNSRIQITVYPTFAKVGVEKCRKVYNNLGSLDETKLCELPQVDPGPQFSEANGSAPRQINYSISTTRDMPANYYKERTYVKNENVWGNYGSLKPTEEFIE